MRLAGRRPTHEDRESAKLAKNSLTRGVFVVFVNAVVARENSL